MICQLPSRLRSLVEHVEQLATDEEITQCLEANQIIRIASDGGAIPGRASYGWIIQIGSTEIAKGKGPTHGNDPRSFRAEGYGMASSLLYLRLLQRQFDFQRERRTTNIIICDNQGLLTRIEEAVEWTYTTPNVTLRAEWDIESVILNLYQELEINFTFMHVKSHQDDETTTANLSLESRLNVEADRLATAYMQEDLTRRPVVTLFPTAKVQPIIQEASVTRRIPQAIRFAAGMKDMEEYCWTVTHGLNKHLTTSIGKRTERATHITAHNAATSLRCATATSQWERRFIAARQNTHRSVPDAGMNQNRKTITSNAAQSPV